MTRRQSIISLSLYTALAFLIMWGLFFLGKCGIIKPASPLFMVVFVVGSWGPTIAAVLTLLVLGEGRDIGQLFTGWTCWKVGAGWILAALSPFAVAGLIVLIYVGLMGKPIANPSPQTVFSGLLVVFLSGFLTGPTGEEPGWRAFATPRLQQHLSALVASVVLGIIWALWHLPLWFLKGTPQFGSPYAPFALSCAVQTVFFTWIFNNTRGSLAMASLLHFSLNVSLGLIAVLGLVPMASYIWIQSVVYAILVIVVIGVFGGRRLSLKPVSEMPFERITG
jgi:uncharacterized protein